MGLNHVRTPTHSLAIADTGTTGHFIQPEALPTTMTAPTSPLMSNFLTATPSLLPMMPTSHGCNYPHHNHSQNPPQPSPTPTHSQSVSSVTTTALPRLTNMQSRLHATTTPSWKAPAYPMGYCPSHSQPDNPT